MTGLFPLRTTAARSSAVLLLLLAGCAGTRLPEESRAREQVASVKPLLETPADEPALTDASTTDDYLRFALRKHPAVKAAFADWQASVEAITPARSLPDPRLTLEADYADELMSFMPGLMFDFMGPGKRAAMGNEMAAASRVAYRTYAGVVLKTAANLRKAWIDFAYLEETVKLHRESLQALEQALAVSEIDYTTTRGMANLEAQTTLHNRAARLRAELVSDAHRRAAARGRFKAALGLQREDADPAWPRIPLGTTTLPTEDELWAKALAANPELASMRSMVDMAVSSVAVARKAGTPDYALGLMADLKADPLMLRPTASVSLPIWRDKIKATLAIAEARQSAASARVDLERLNMAAEIAQMFHMLREAEAMIRLIDETELPNLERTLATTEASAQSGMGSAMMIPEFRIMTLSMRLERLAAMREREMTATDLLLMMAEGTPDNAPLLKTAAETSK